MPKIGNPIAEGIGGALNSLAQGYAQNIKRQRAEEIFANPNASDIQKISALENFLPKQGAKLYQALIEQKQLKNEDIMMGKYFGDNKGAPINSVSPVQDLMRGQKQFANLKPGVSPFNINAVPQEQPMQKQASENQDVEAALKQKVEQLIDLSGKVNSEPAKRKVNNALKYNLNQLDNISREKSAMIKAEQKELDRQERMQKNERDYSTQITEDFRNRNQALRVSLPMKEQALQMARQAIMSRKVGAFSGANLARVTGRNEFETPEGAALNLASKTFLVGNLNEVSARAQNRWVEQVMSRAFPLVGQQEEANLVVLEGVQASYDLEKAELEIATQLEQQDLHTLGYISMDIAYRTEEAMKPIRDEILGRMSYKTKMITEDTQSDEDLMKQANKRVEKGTALTRRNLRVLSVKYNGDRIKALKHAKQMGYTIPTNKQVKEWTE